MILNLKTEFSGYHSLGEDDGYFTDYKGMSVRDWFRANSHRFLFPLEAIRKASKPYGDAPWGCGVYFLFLDEELMYVGLSIRIGQRMGHHKMQDPIRPAAWFNRYSALWVPDLLMKDVECYYIHKFAPPRNDQVWAPNCFMKPYIDAA